MKLGSTSKVLAGVSLALLMTGGVAWAAPSPQKTSRIITTAPSRMAEMQRASLQGASTREPLPIMLVRWASAGPHPAQPTRQKPSKQQKGQKKGQKQPSLYPNATRKSPTIKPFSKKDAKQLNSGLAAIKAHNTALAKKILTPYAEGKSTDNKYLQGVALQALANMEYNAGNVKKAIAMVQKALATNALPNNTHFQLMYELAQFYYASKQYQPALDALHKWRKEGRRQTAASYGLEGIIDYQLKQYKPAIAAITKAKSMTTKPNKNWDQVLAVSYAETGQGGQAIAMAKKQLAANPKDAGTRHNLIALLMTAGKNDAALKQMEKARSLGQLTTSAGYTNLAKLYLIAGQNSNKDPRPYADKALAVLKEASHKGTIKPDYAYYKLLGDANSIGGYTKAALAAYTKAAPLGTDGAADMSRAQLLAADHKYSAARNAARKALSKGTKHKGRAYMLIAKTERALGDQKAAVAAMKKAAQYPSTRAEAQAWLKKAGY